MRRYCRGPAGRCRPALPATASRRCLRIAVRQRKLIHSPCGDQTGTAITTVGRSRASPPAPPSAVFASTRWRDRRYQRGTLRCVSSGLTDTVWTMPVCPVIRFLDARYHRGRRDRDFQTFAWARTRLTTRCPCRAEIRKLVPEVVEGQLTTRAAIEWNLPQAIGGWVRHSGYHGRRRPGRSRPGATWRPGTDRRWRLHAGRRRTKSATISSSKM